MSQYNEDAKDESANEGNRRSFGQRSNNSGGRGFNSRSGGTQRKDGDRRGGYRGGDRDRRDGDRSRGDRQGSGSYRGNREGGRRFEGRNDRDGERRSYRDRDDRRGYRGRDEARDNRGTRGGDDRRGGGRRFNNDDRRDDRRGHRSRDDDRGYRGWEGNRDNRGGRGGDERHGGRRFNDDDRRNDRRGGGRDFNPDDRRGGGRDFNRDDRRGGNRDDRRGNDRRSNDRGGRGDDRGFQHANRGGANRAQQSGPQRSGYREERINKRINEPAVPADIDPKELDPSVRQELRSLAKDNADMVAKHLIMTAVLLDEEPQKALEHARAAKDRAGRVSVARETNGIAAYHAGEWKEAISELRAARRMSGGPGLLAVLADAERGLGRPEKALEVSREHDVEELDPESRVELAIVVAGAHHDLDDKDAALITLQDVLELPDVPEVNRLRLYYAYADALELVGRNEEAIEWFQKSAELDTEDLMDIEDRIAALNGESAPESE